MTKVMIVGDTHSYAEFVSKIHKEARTNEVEVIVQLGDFGFTFDKNMIDSISAWLDRDPNHKWFWIDGNHDEHNVIDSLVREHGYDNPISMGQIAGFPDRLFYCPRSCVWTIGETVCMAMGGAFSIDKDDRRVHVSWWPQEMITAGDVERAFEASKKHDVDVMFTHDIPVVEGFESKLTSVGYKNDVESYTNRLMLSSIVEEVRPKVLYHGHFHHRHTDTFPYDGGEVLIEGVGANVAIPMRWARMNDAIEEWNFLIREF